MGKAKKKHPTFKNEDEERRFWAEHEVTEYFEESILRVEFTQLKPSTKTITVRIPESMLAHLKVLAHKRDIPYQSLLKIYLAEKIDEEYKKTG